jgi:hypothetical protein
MKGKFSICVLIPLILGLCVIFLNTPAFAFFEPSTIVIARAEESNYIFSEAEEDMKEEDWLVIPEEVQEEGDEEGDEDQGYAPNTEEGEDFYKYVPYESDERFPGPEDSEEEPEDTETRR